MIAAKNEAFTATDAKGAGKQESFHRRWRRGRNGAEVAEEPQPNDHGDSQLLRVSVAGVASDVGDVVR